MQSAFAPQSVTITLAEDVDISRGDLITGVDDAPAPLKEFEATLCWMSQNPMKAGAKVSAASYDAEGESHGFQTSSIGSIPTRWRRRPDLAELQQNDIARVTVKTLLPIACDPYRENRETGAFILIDDANDTVGAGFVES